MNGFLFIDKPTGITSFDVVYKVRKKLGGRSLKVGHTGTLDPLATGLLVLAIGQATKFIEYLTGVDKEYECKAVFGASSNTYDADGEVVQSDLSSDFSLNEGQIEDLIKQKFLGKIQQIPPAYSAKWVDGKRAHQLARKGKELNLKPSEIEVYDFELLKFVYLEADFRVKVSSGTYIRSLIHDLGKELNCGAYVKQLRRSKVSDSKVKDAIALNDFRELANPQEKIISVEAVMKHVFPILNVESEELEHLRHGRELDVEQDLENEMYSVFCDGKFCGVAAALRKNTIKFRKQFLFD